MSDSLTISEMRFLRCLSNNQSFISSHEEIKQKTGLSLSTIWNTAVKLQLKGLIVLFEERDARIKSYQLTQKGKKLLGVLQ